MADTRKVAHSFDLAELLPLFRSPQPLMIFSVRFYIASALAIALAMLPVAGRGTTFNWTTTPAFPTGPTGGNTVSAVYGGLGAVTISNVKDPSTGTAGVWEAGYPTVNKTDTTGGNTPAVNGLQLYVASQPTTNSYMKVTITFGYTGGATNVSLTLWDVDEAANFDDKISNIVGVTASGALVPLTVVGSADNSVTGSGTVNATALGMATSPNTQNTGNVTITSGTVPIQAITFQYSDANTGGTNTRTTQIIGVSPITFTPVGSATPEMGSALGGLALCGGVVGLGALRKRKSGPRA